MLDVLVRARGLRVSRRERAGRTLPMDRELSSLPVDGVLLDLDDVVSDIVYDAHPEFLGGPTENTLERAPCAVRDELAVVPREVRAAGHRLPVVLPFGGVDWRACELAVRKLDPVFLERPLRGRDVVGRDLVPEPSRARVNHDADLIGAVESQCLRRFRVVHSVDLLDLEEVIP